MILTFGATALVLEMYSAAIVAQAPFLKGSVAMTDGFSGFDEDRYRIRINCTNCFPLLYAVIG
jgi:hypothetical protein